MSEMLRHYGIPATFVSNDRKWKLEWEYIGEGLAGDYDPEDGGDVPLLRANLYQKVGRRWQAPPDSSYCTLAPAYTNKWILENISKALFKDLGRKTKFRKSIMESWSWSTNPRDYF